MVPASAGKSPKANSRPGSHPPRPRNAWMIYRSEKWKALLGRQPSGTVLKQADISRIIAEDWANEPEAVRVEYERKARAVKEEHARMYPDYKYTPVPKAERERRKAELKAAKVAERTGRTMRGQRRQSSDADAGPSGSMDGQRTVADTSQSHATAGDNDTIMASFATSRTSLDHRATYAVVPSQLHVDIDPSRWGDGSFGSDDALVQNVTVDEMMARARSAFSLADHLRDTSSWVHEPSRDAEPLSLEELQMAWSLARSSDLAAPQRIDLLGMAAETEVDLSADQALTQNRGGSASPLVAAQGWGDGEHPFSFIVDGDWVSDMADGRGRYL